MQQFKPRDKAYEAKVRESFGRQKIMDTIGAEIVSIGPGEVELALPFQQKLTQQHGFLHAGAVSTLLDSACGYAALSLMPEEAGVLSIEFKINLLSPAAGERFHALGKVKKPGRTITVTEGELIAYRDGQAKVVASMVATMMSIVGREGIKN